MAVALVLIVFLLQLFSVFTSNWQSGETRIDAYREARAALHIMSRDLSQTIPPQVVPPTATTPGATPAPVSSDTLSNLPVLVLDKYPVVTNDSTYEEAYCLTTIPNNGASALCAVGYYCHWDDTRRTFVLYRQFQNSDDTFQRLHAAQNDRPVTFLDVFSRNPIPNVPITGITASTGSTMPGSTELAAYVWDLQFRIDKTIMSTTNSEPPTSHVSGNGSQSYGVTPPYPSMIPAFVEIRFKALSTSAGRRLEGNPAVSKDTWTNTDDPLYKNTILPAVQQFTARVPLINYNAANSALPLTSSTP